MFFVGSDVNPATPRQGDTSSKWWSQRFDVATMDTKGGKCGGDTIKYYKHQEWFSFWDYEVAKLFEQLKKMI